MSQQRRRERFRPSFSSAYVSVSPAASSAGCSGSRFASAGTPQERLGLCHAHGALVQVGRRLPELPHRAGIPEGAQHPKRRTNRDPGNPPRPAGYRPATVRVLFVAYHFPPVGGAGVQRSVKFLRYLPEHGWDPVVVTGPVGSIGDAHRPTRRSATSCRRPWRSTGSTARSRCPRAAGAAAPSAGSACRRAWSRWWGEGAVEAGKQARGVDLVLATMSPFESCAAAAALARHHGVPWVADLRDPWALDEMRVYPTRLHRWLELRRMRAGSPRLRRRHEHAGGRPAAATCVPGARALAGLRDPERLRCIRLRGTAPSRPPQELPDRPHRRPAHGVRAPSPAGGPGRRLLGGTLGEIDILTRSHVFLIEALERLLDRRPDLRGVLQLHLAGGLDEADRAAIRTDAVTRTAT